MLFNKVNIPKLARNRYDYVAQGSGGGTTIISGSSGGDNSISRLIEPIYSDEGEICGIRALYSVAVQGGITTYREGEGINLPSIYDGMPIDNITLYWDNGVLKSKGTDGMDEGRLKTYLDTNAYINNANKANYFPSWALATNKPAYTWGEISNKPAWIGSDKPAYAWTEIGSKPTWIGANKPSYVWTEIGGKPSWIGESKPSYTFSEIGGKPTTLLGYGITDAVTLNTAQTVTGAKNFTGGLSVNGCAIVYDTANKVWKLTGNLLVTGGITAYGDVLSGSAILDALPIDATLSKANGVLSVIGGGGFLSSITVKLGTVAYNSADGIVSLPAYPTTLPASDVSAWAKAAGKPAYTWGEIGGKPSTFTPSAHSHAISEITNLQGLLDGKAANSHTHNYASTVKVGTTGYNVTGNVISLPEYPTALKSPNALTISLNGASQGAYDGSAAKSFNINYSNVGAPSTTGANASGTWGINVSGRSYKLDVRDTRATNANPNDIIGDYNCIGAWFSNAGTPSGDWWSGITVKGWAANYAVWQLAGISTTSIANNNLHVRFGVGTTWNSWRALAFTDDNVASATKLLNVRTIWGQSFDGTGNVGGNLNLGGSNSILGKDNRMIVRDHNNGSVTFSATGDGVYLGYEYTKNLYLYTGSGSGISNQRLHINQDGKIGIGITAQSSYQLYISGNLHATGNIQTGAQLISTIGNGTAPLAINSTTQVNYLNADLLDGYHANGLFTKFDYSSGVINSTIGGTNRSIVFYNAMTTTSVGSEQTGYLIFAKITINAQYQDKPLIFLINGRGTNNSGELTVNFNGAAIDTTSMGVTELYYSGRLPLVYAVKTSNNTYELYITRTAWQDYSFTLLNKGNSHTIEFKAVFSTTLPSYQAVSTPRNPASELYTARTFWGQSFNGTGNVSGTLTGVTGITMSGTFNNSGTTQLGSSNTYAKLNTGTFNFSNGDATLSIFGVAGSSPANGNETACIQSAFDNQNPETSTYPTTYPTRAVLALQPRGGNVAINKTTANSALDVNGLIQVKSKAFNLDWGTAFNPANAALGDSQNLLVNSNYYHPMVGWMDTVNGQGYVTRYTIGSYRGSSQWGKMILAVSNNDGGTSRGAEIGIHGNGTVTIEGNLLVTGGITQYGGGVSLIDTFTANLFKANNCLLVGSSTVQDAPERYICCYGKTGSSYICIGNAPSAGNTGEICYTHVGTGHLDNSISLGFYGGQQFGRLLLRARGNNFLDGSLTASGTITQGSDMRRKTVIRSITSLTTDQIANAPLFDYYWKDLNDGAHTGTSAQYWQNILPNTVRDNGINGFALDYNGVNIAGLITVSREIVKLKRENEELRQEINKLKEREA